MKNRKILILSIALIGMFLLNVGTFAYYMKVVNGTIKGNTGAFTFDVLHNSTTFKNIDLYETMENPSLTSKYIIPGDSGKFDLLVDATGTLTGVEYEIDFVGTNIPTNMKFYLDENKTEEIGLEYGLLGYIKSTDETKNKLYTIYWEWPYDSGDYNDDDINYQDKEMTFDVTATGKQSNGYAMMKNEYKGWNANSIAMWDQKYATKVRTITFSNDLSNLPNSCTEENLCWDITADSSAYPVYQYFVVNETYSNYYDVYIVSESKIYAPNDSKGLFALTSASSGRPQGNIKTINFNDVFSTSKVKNMDQMFLGDSSLTEIDLSSFDTSNVINMHWMFGYCAGLKELDLSNFDTSNVTNMSQMFAGDYSSLEKIVFSYRFDTSNVTDMSSMFYRCKSLTSLDLSNFNTSNVTDMQYMFYECTSLTSLSFGYSFYTTSVTNMDSMFYECSSLTSLDLSRFNTSNVTTMRFMFWWCSSLTSLSLGSNFNTSKVTDMQYMFYLCKKLTTSITIRNSNLKNYSDIFKFAANDGSAKITVNYTTATESLVDKMIATKPSDSNVVKGTKQ